MMIDDDRWWRGGLIKNPRPPYYTNTYTISIIKWSRIFVLTTTYHHSSFVIIIWWWRGGRNKNPRPLYYTSTYTISIIKSSRIFVSTTASHQSSSVIICHHHLMMKGDKLWPSKSSFYKLVSAILSKSLKPLLDNLLGHEQKAYIPGRFIS